LAQDKIEAVCIEENAIIVGTLRGCVHVISFAGQGIRTFSSHKQPVRGVSADNVGLNIASCSADGNVVLYGLGEVEVNQIVVSMKQPLTAICVDKISLSKKDKSFIVGTCFSMNMYFKRVLRPDLFFHSFRLQIR
jgi:WD40 repeat protein